MRGLVKMEEIALPSLAKHCPTTSKAPGRIPLSTNTYPLVAYVDGELYKPSPEAVKLLIKISVCY
jgi:hypothetical protein